MRISPVTQFAALGSGAVGATIAIVVLGGGGHSAQPPAQYQLHQDAATGAAVITSGAPSSSAKPVAPKLAVVTSTVVVKQPAIQQEAPVATDPSTDPAPADTLSAADPASTYPPPRGNPVGSVFNNPYPSATLATDSPTPAGTTPHPR